MTFRSPIRPQGTIVAATAIPWLLLAGCHGPDLATVPTQPTVIQREAAGWTRVVQPGWFSALMPHAPEHGELKTTAPQGGVLVMKQVSTTSNGTMLAIAYAQLEGFDDHDAMLAEVRKTWQEGGAVPIQNVDIVVGGRDGVEGWLDIPPGTKLNPSTSHMSARVRVLLDQSRAYLLIGIEPSNTQASILPRFFDSFEFAPVAR
ncbi:MAG: hypothetical protein HY898_18380 [Deltaproteobacteria bacterium]|nr:hypothetical protein [Deltaproteobacteria bacterium]